MINQGLLREIGRQLVRMDTGTCYRIDRRVVDELFEEPKPEPFLDFALAHGGHRPRSTQQELLRLFANDKGCEVITEIYGDVTFKKIAQTAHFGQ